MGKRVEKALRGGAPTSASSRAGDDCCEFSTIFILNNTSHQWVTHGELCMRTRQYIKVVKLFLNDIICDHCDLSKV